MLLKKDSGRKNKHVNIRTYSFEKKTVGCGVILCNKLGTLVPMMSRFDVKEPQLKRKMQTHATK